MLIFVISLGDFHLKIPAHYVRSQTSTGSFDAVIQATGERIASALGGDYLYCEDDAGNPV